MINNSFSGKGERPEQKQQDVQFINRLQAGLNCSPFEVKAILNCIYEVCQPFFDNTASMKTGHIFFEVSVENSAKEKLSGCQMKTVILTLDAGVDDLSVREREGVIGLCRHGLQRIAAEAFQLDGLFTVEDIANRLLNCGKRTLTRDIKAFKDTGICLPLRSTIKNMGRTVSHREMIVKHWFSEMKFSHIARKTNHGIEEITNCVEKLKRVIRPAKDNREIKTIAFPVKISVSPAQQYYDLFQNWGIIPNREEELNERIKKNDNSNLKQPCQMIQISRNVKQYRSAHDRFLKPVIFNFPVTALRYPGSIAATSVACKLTSIFEQNVPQNDRFKYGQMYWNALDKNTGGDSSKRKYKAVRLPVVTGEVVTVFEKGIPVKEIRKQIIARNMRKACQQGGILSTGIGAFFSAEGSKNSFNFNTVWL